MKSIQTPYDTFLIEWVESGKTDVTFFVAGVGTHASLSGGITRTTDDEGTIFTYRKMFQYFVDNGYAKLNSNVDDVAMYELTDKGCQHASYVKQALPNILKK